jgi:superfamily II DNA helicase RecQ
MFALSASFDYTHVRLVIHVNKLLSLINFAQESGRAGRDRKEAYSLVFLLLTWKLQVAKSTAVERKALHRYFLG